MFYLFTLSKISSQNLISLHYIILFIIEQGIVLYQLFSGNQAPLKKEVLEKLVQNAQLKLKEAYEKLSESERVRFLFVCVLLRVF